MECFCRIKCRNRKLPTPALDSGPIDSSIHINGGEISPQITVEGGIDTPVTDPVSRLTSTMSIGAVL
jgi:hypothetical protein